jgi:hypothetical protein
VEKDYGCGDPTQFVNEGEVVVDLGSGRWEELLYCLRRR